MGKIHLNIFSFDERLDFQSGYVRQDVYYKSQSTLRDILNMVDPKLFGYHKFGVNVEYIHCRINDLAIFGNFNTKELVEHFGNVWTIDPLSKRYAKKDLLLNIDLAFTKYKTFFQKMSFILPSECEELKKFLPINFIVPRYDDEYCGDGFLLYVKWLIERYPLHKKQLLESITMLNGGIFEHSCLANFMFPANNTIDLQIESLQFEVLNAANTFVRKEWVAFGKQLNKQYQQDFQHTSLSNECVMTEQSMFIQNILQTNRNITKQEKV